LANSLYRAEALEYHTARRHSGGTARWRHTPMAGNAKESAGCSSGCVQCAGAGAAETADPPLVGCRLAVAAGGAFVIPLLLALAGAAAARCVSCGPLGSLVGCLAGLAAGVGVARLMTRRLGPADAGTPAGK